MRASLTAILVLCLSPAAVADVVIFDLGSQANGSAVDGVASGMLTRQGITATFSANDGVLNATGSWFGINASGSGDVTDQIDAGSGVSESVHITFDLPVEFLQLSLASFSGSERALLTVGGSPPQLLAATAPAIDVYDFTAASFPQGNVLAAGQPLVIGYTFGSAEDNGFSLSGFQVRAVPEPSSWAVMVPLATAWLRRRRRAAPRTK